MEKKWDLINVSINQLFNLFKRQSYVCLFAVLFLFSIVLMDI